MKMYDKTKVEELFNPVYPLTPDECIDISEPDHDIRLVFHIIVNGNKRQVLDIPGKEHDGLNDSPKTWWLYTGQCDTFGNSFVIDMCKMIPYDKASMNSNSWDIRITQPQTFKSKFDSVRVTNTTHVTMSVNKVKVYEFDTFGDSKGLDYAMNKASVLRTTLTEHPYDFLNPETEKGRKIYYLGLPAIVQPKYNMTWEIMIYPDTSEIDMNTWLKLHDERSDVLKITSKMTSMEYINYGDALDDKYINWFRS